MSEDLMKKDEPNVVQGSAETPVEKPVKKPVKKPVGKLKPSDDFVVGPGGDKIYDKGEAIKATMNREKAGFDLDLFFTELYEDYLICVQRGDVRQKPGSHLILRWDLGTTFEDFMTDAIEHLDKQIESITVAKVLKPKKFETIGDSALDEIKIDAGSSQVGRQYDNEDYDATHEILRKSKEAVVAMLAGRLKLIVNKNSGRIRVTGNI